MSMYDKTNVKRFIYAALCAMLSAMAFTTDFSRGEYRLQNMLGTFSVLGLILIIVFFKFFMCAYKKNVPLARASTLVPALLFAAIMLVGSSFKHSGDFSLILGSKARAALAFVCFVGYALFFNAAIACAFRRVTSLKPADKEPKNKFLRAVLIARPVLFPALIMLACWIPYIIVDYPGTLVGDTWGQLYEAMGFESRGSQLSQFPAGSNTLINTMNPVPHTLLLGGAYKLFWMLGNAELGIFVFCITQTVIMAFTLAYTLYYMGKLNISYKFRACVFAFYCLCPLFKLYAYATHKDTLYALVFLQMFIVLIRLFKEGDAILAKPAKAIGFGAVLFLFMIVRNPAMYIFIVSLFFILPCILKRLKGGRASKIRLCAVLIAPIILSLLVTNVVYPALGFGKGPINEALSMPFQQTARYATKYPATESEREAINEVLNYDELATEYAPQISDPVKNPAKLNVTLEGWKRYFGAWFAQLKKHPLCYAEATINMNYEYYYPDVTFNDYIMVFSLVKDERDLGDMRFIRGYVEFNPPKALAGAVRFVDSLYDKAHTIPGLGLTLNMGMYMWLLILAAFIFRYAKKRGGSLLTPFVLTMLGLSFTAVNGGFRYAIPIILSMPMIVAYTICECRAEKTPPPES